MTLPTLSLPTLERGLFYLLLAANLIPLWSVHYFVTGDGPCHLYNAKVLLDFYHGGDLKDFYNPWLFVNGHFEPNWFGHVFMELLLGWGTPAYLAEKFLQTFYVLSFGLGLRFLVRQVNPNALFISTFGLLLTYHHVFQMGFYNYSCSLAIMFWVSGFWLKYRHQWTVTRMLLQAVGFLALYFCHPIGLVFSFLVIGSVLLVELAIGLARRDRSTEQSPWETFRSGALSVTLSAMPVIILFAEYVFVKGLNPSPRSESALQIWEELQRFTALSILMTTEKSWAICVAVFFALLLGLALLFKIRSRQWRWTDVFLPVFGIALLIYLKQPGGIAGAGILPIRLQLLPYLMLLIWLGSIDFPKWLQAGTMAFTVVVFVGLMRIRLPHHRMASNAAIEYASCGTVIPDRVSVLPISFNHNGLDPISGREVADHIWLYMHSGDYIGAEKSIVMLANYEAATQNFPLIWRWERNPYDRLKKDNASFEDQPPAVDIVNYPKNSTNATVDYVVTWCLDQRKFGEHPRVLDIEEQLRKEYELIFTSPHGLAKVFKRIAR